MYVYGAVKWKHQRIELNCLHCRMVKPFKRNYLRISTDSPTQSIAQVSKPPPFLPANLPISRENVDTPFTKSRIDVGSSCLWSHNKMPTLFIMFSSLPHSTITKYLILSLCLCLCLRLTFPPRFSFFSLFRPRSPIPCRDQNLPTNLPTLLWSHYLPW